MVSDNTTDTKNFLKELLQKCSSQDSLLWLDGQIQKIKSEASNRTFNLTFSMITRRFKKDLVELSPGELKIAKELRPGLNPSNWTCDQTARILLVLSLPAEEEEKYLKSLELLFSTADMNEQVALFRSLPLLPYPEKFVDRAVDGLRTNMTVVFDAISLDNPYPSEYFEELAWNQMVLKAAFMDRPIYKIYGLEKRANATLAKIISDYAHERWAAGRVVSPEFWRPVSPFLNEVILGDLERLFKDEMSIQQEAAALVCMKSDHPKAKTMVEKWPDLVSRIENGNLTWDTLAKEWWASK